MEEEVHDQQTQRKIVKVKRVAANPEKVMQDDGEGEGIVYSEDEFEEEIIVERENDDYDDENDDNDDEW